MSKPKASRDLARWQLRAPAPRFSLEGLDPAAKPFSTGDKPKDKLLVDELAGQIDELQDMLYADRRFKLLVVLQGTDGSGKDGTIRHVFGRVSPLGSHAWGWKAPTEEERAHDFLWRIHKAVPGAGEVGIFNRSHYEDVLVPMAEFGMKPAEAKQRCRQILDFERMLAETGTVVLKFMLLISREEQQARLQARIDDASKAWKYDPHDLEVRKRWDAYRKAYEFVLRETGADHAPWTIVPANSKTHRNVMIGTVVRDALAALKLRYPPAKDGVAGTRVE